MSFVPCLLGFVVYVLVGRKEVKNLLKFAAGFTISLFTVLGMLVVRGEFSGYIEMIRVNFHYRNVYPSVIGFEQGITGHIKTINLYGSSFHFLILASILMTAILIQRIRNKDHVFEGSILLLTFMGPILVLLSSAMWSHHLQILSICLYVMILTLGLYQRDFQSNVGAGVRVVSSLLIVASFAAISATGWKLPLRPTTSISEVVNPNWIEPSEVKFIKARATTFVLEKKFARLGPNDDYGLLGFMPKEWKLSCRYYSQYGHETEEMVGEIISCISSEPNYVFISPGFFALERASGTYKNLKIQAEKVLNENFRCVAIEDRLGAQFCTRITAPIR
jgi:hypothetical protein